MLKLHPTIKNTAIASTVALIGAGGMTSCLYCNENSNQTKQTVQTIQTPALTPKKEMDFSKPNLPVIDEEKVSYRNVDGDVIEISADKRTKSLYQAINKFSTNKNPDIDDVEAFYCEVEKDNKNYGIMEFDATIRTTLVLQKLYDMFTAPDSEGGKTITVKEYTHMMDAWSSTGYNKKCYSN